MTAKNDLVGLKFHRLYVVKVGGFDHRRNIRWECLCDCGGTTYQFAYDLRSGRVKSCGCWVKDHPTGLKHGMARSAHKRNKTYSVWAAMIQRCTNERDANWGHYGGRGIGVCDRWLVFDNFLADMGEKPEGLTIDRVDNSTGYSKENCRWASRHEQGRNTRANVWITVDGVSKLQVDWCRELGTTSSHFAYCKRRGIPAEVFIKKLKERNHGNFGK